MWRRYHWRVKRPSPKQPGSRPTRQCVIVPLCSENVCPEATSCDTRPTLHSSTSSGGSASSGSATVCGGQWERVLALAEDRLLNARSGVNRIPIDRSRASDLNRSVPQQLLVANMRSPERGGEPSPTLQPVMREACVAPIRPRRHRVDHSRSASGLCGRGMIQPVSRRPPVLPLHAV